MGYHPLINHEYKFIIFWNAKCGCSTLKDHFLYITYGTPSPHPIDEVNKIGGAMLRECPKSELYTKYADYVKIIVVRNPWKRLVSYYTSKICHIVKENYGPSDEHSYYRLNKIKVGTPSFKELILKLNQLDKYRFEHHLELQTENIEDIDFNYIINISQINNDLKKVFRELNIRNIPDTSKKWPLDITPYSRNLNEYVYNYKPADFNVYNVPSYKYFYNDELKDTIANIYREDIERFNFRFEE